MNDAIRRDAAQRPDLFLWNGPLDSDALAEWVRSQAWTPPTPLVSLWQETGGGEVFEGEVFLSPFGREMAGESFEATNTFWSQRGKPVGQLLFEVGATEGTAYDLHTDHYVVLSLKDFTVLASFPSLEEWYMEYLRPQYADRYALAHG